MATPILFLCSNCFVLIMTKISIQDFLSQAHPDTLDWFENHVLNGLIKIDELNKRKSVVAYLKKSITELNNTVEDENLKSF